MGVVSPLSSGIAATNRCRALFVLVLVVLRRAASVHVHYDCEPLSVTSADKFSDPRSIYGRLVPMGEKTTGEEGVKYLEQCFYGAGFTDCEHASVRAAL